MLHPRAFALGGAAMILELMQHWELSLDCIEDYIAHNTLYISNMQGISKKLEDERLLSKIHQWEQETGNKVYHVVETPLQESRAVLYVQVDMPEGTPSDTPLLDAKLGCPSAYLLDLQQPSILIASPSQKGGISCTGGIYRDTL